MFQLIVGPNVLRECETVVRRKAGQSLPLLAQLLNVGRVETGPAPTARQIKIARSIVAYEPDANVLAEAMQVAPDWFVTHDKEHFLMAGQISSLDFVIGTPGDLIQALRDNFSNFI